MSKVASKVANKGVSKVAARKKRATAYNAGQRHQLLSQWIASTQDADVFAVSQGIDTFQFRKWIREARSTGDLTRIRHQQVKTQGSAYSGKPNSKPNSKPNGNHVNQAPAFQSGDEPIMVEVERLRARVRQLETQLAQIDTLAADPDAVLLVARWR